MPVPPQPSSPPPISAPCSADSFWLDRLKTAIQQNDFETIQFIAHKFVGSLFSLGIPEASTHAYLLERRASDKEESGTMDVLGEFEIELKKIVDYLTQYKRDRLHHCIQPLEPVGQ